MERSGIAVQDTLWGSPKEAPIQKAILDFLSVQRCVHWHARINSGAMKKSHQRKDGKSMDYFVQFFRFDDKSLPENERKTFPDIIGMLLNGAWLAVEVKRDKERPTVKQCNFLLAVWEAGGCAGIARSVEDCQLILARDSRPMAEVYETMRKLNENGSNPRGRSARSKR